MRNIIIAASLLVLALGCEDPSTKVVSAKVNTPATPAAASAPAAPASAAMAAKTGATLKFDNTGSKLQWVGSKVTGSHDGGFNKFSGTINLAGDDLTTAKITVNIDTTSVFSDADKLTKHLKSGDFFDVEKFPKASFTSTKIEKGAGGKFMVTGDLMMRGITKSITFPADLSVSDGKASAKAEFSINRKDWGIVYTGKPDDLIRDGVVMKFDVNAS